MNGDDNDDVVLDSVDHSETGTACLLDNSEIRPARVYIGIVRDRDNLFNFVLGDFPFI